MGRVAGRTGLTHHESEEGVRAATARRRGLVIAASVTAINGAVMAVSERRPTGGSTVRDLLVPDGRGIDAGEAWRPVTSLIVHENLPHLLINTALLCAVAPFATRRLGLARTAVVYVAGGFAANALRYAVGGRHGGGASGAILAVAAAAATASMADRDNRWGPFVIGCAAVVGLAVARVASDAHLLALGIGGMLGLAAREGRKQRTFAVLCGMTAAFAAGAMGVRMLSA